VPHLLSDKYYTFERKINMLVKVCENCNQNYTLARAGKKEQRRRFCGPICSRTWCSNNRSSTWKEKASAAKKGENNPMYGVAQTNPNSLGNLNRKGFIGTHTVESKKRISDSLTGFKHSEESKLKMSKAKTKWLPDDPEYTAFKKYKRKVYYWTAKNDLTQLANYEKRSRTGYHLDHKYSISEGFKNNVKPEIVGHIINLEFLPHKVNISKGAFCSQSKEKLYGLFQGRDRSL
jgi:hypothetical protein